MLVTEAGIVMDFSEVHCSNAWYGMLVTESGIVTEVSELH